MSFFAKYTKIDENGSILLKIELQAILLLKKLLATMR